MLQALRAGSEQRLGAAPSLWGLLVFCLAFLPLGWFAWEIGSHPPNHFLLTLGVLMMLASSLSLVPLRWSVDFLLRDRRLLILSDFYGRRSETPLASLDEVVAVSVFPTRDWRWQAALLLPPDVVLWLGRSDQADTGGRERVLGWAEAIAAELGVPLKVEAEQQSGSEWPPSMKPSMSVGLTEFLEAGPLVVRDISTWTEQLVTAACCLCAASAVVAFAINRANPTLAAWWPLLAITSLVGGLLRAAFNDVVGIDGDRQEIVPMRQWRDSASRGRGMPFRELLAIAVETRLETRRLPQYQVVAFSREGRRQALSPVSLDYKWAAAEASHLAQLCGADCFVAGEAKATRLVQEGGRYRLESD